MTPTTFPSTPRPNARKAHLLVVEDNPDHWTLIQAACHEAMPDVEVVWAAGANQALAHLATCHGAPAGLPKLMLTDLYLPDIEQAWQLLQTLKQRDSPYLRMPVVVFSSSDNQDDIKHFYQFGGTSYIVKPTDYEQWVGYFQTVRQYWWETVTLPNGW